MLRHPSYFPFYPLSAIMIHKIQNRDFYVLQIHFDSFFLHIISFKREKYYIQITIKFLKKTQ